jgi:broad specificity phosphatase PhoE
MADFDKKYQGDLYHPELTAKGGETMQQIQNRMLKALQSYVRKHPNQNIIAVSHGDPIRIIQMTTQNLKLTKPNLGSDRHPTPEIQYPEKGSLTILKTKNNRLIQLDYWPPPTISSG